MHHRGSWRSEIERAAREGELRDFLRENTELEPEGSSWRVVVDITAGCDLRCPMCPRAGRSDDIADDGFLDGLIGAVLPRAEDLSLGCLHEPLLHPDLRRVLSSLDAARRSTGSHAHLVLLTSGHGLDEPRVDVLAHAHMDAVLFSIDTTHEATYARLRHPARWRRTRSGLIALLARSAGSCTRVGVQALIMRSIWSRLPATVRALAGMGIERVQLTQLTQVPPSIAHEVLRISDPCFGRLEEMLVQLTASARRRGLELSHPVHDRTPSGQPVPLAGEGRVWDEDRIRDTREAVCVAPWFRLRIDARGDVFPCNFIRSAAHAWGNIHRDDFEAIANSRRAVEMRSGLAAGRAPIEECASCPYGPRPG